MDNINKLLGNMTAIIARQCPIDKIKDIKIRENYNIIVNSTDNQKIVIDKIASNKDIVDIIARATGDSIYAFEDELSEGYLYFDGGIRIGVSGAYNVVNGRLVLKHFSCLNIRAPKEIIGAADGLAIIVKNFKNTLIISPPGAGKTTLLRDAIRKLSEHYNIVVIDERYEISGGMPPKFNFGRGVDFIAGVDKQTVLCSAIRSMSPEILAMDEIFGDNDFRLIKELSNSGVNILATMHASIIDNAKNRLGEIYEVFENIVILSSTPYIGNIKSIVRTI